MGLRGTMWNVLRKIGHSGRDDGSYTRVYFWFSASNWVLFLGEAELPVALGWPRPPIPQPRRGSGGHQASSQWAARPAFITNCYRDSEHSLPLSVYLPRLAQIKTGRPELQSTPDFSSVPIAGLPPSSLFPNVIFPYLTTLPFATMAENLASPEGPARRPCVTRRSFLDPRSYIAGGPCVARRSHLSRRPRVARR